MSKCMNEWVNSNRIEKIQRTTQHVVCACCFIFLLLLFLFSPLGFFPSQNTTIVQIFNKLNCICEWYQFHFMSECWATAKKLSRKCVQEKTEINKKKKNRTRETDETLYYIHRWQQNNINNNYEKQTCSIPSGLKIGNKDINSSGNEYSNNWASHKIWSKKNKTTTNYLEKAVAIFLDFWFSKFIGIYIFQCVLNM